MHDQAGNKLGTWPLTVIDTVAPVLPEAFAAGSSRYPWPARRAKDSAAAGPAAREAPSARAASAPWRAAASAASLARNQNDAWISTMKNKNTNGRTAT